MSSPSPSAISDTDHDTYHPPNSPGTVPDAHTTTSKRGRKPAPGSRAVREANRKANHSIIEKRRREKINETMTALRSLLADGYIPPKAQADVEQQDPKSHASNGKKTQDFKLEVLTRSVDYIQQLLDRVSSLESELQRTRIGTHNCSRCTPNDTSEAERASKKRKRGPTIEGTLAPQPSSRLPSISSLLNPQLPSPPLTVPMPPTMVDVPPALTLPAATSHGSTSPPAPWTPDEAQVATLLLGISSKSGSPTSSTVTGFDVRSPASPKAVNMTPAGAGTELFVGMHPAMTPAGMLGMRSNAV